MLGYYAHNHGSGHVCYASLFAASLDLTLFTAATDVPGDVRVVALPDDYPDASTLDLDRFPPPFFLHYAPLGSRKMIDRYRRILGGVVDEGIDFLIVDVSVEVAAFARLCGIPTAYVRLMGDRSDPPHLAAFESATFLLAYYPEAMEAPETPDWVRRKTLYLGFFSRFSTANTPKSPSHTIVVIHGRGGASPPPINFDNLRRCFPDHEILTVGATDVDPRPPGVRHLGHVEDPRHILNRADFVIGSCGLATTSELASLDQRFVAVPDVRPFGEQAQLADALAANGLCLRATTNESDLAERVAALQPDWTPHVRRNAVSAFADWFRSHAGDVRALADDVVHRRFPHS